jgi:hypothetical protein
MLQQRIRFAPRDVLHTRIGSNSYFVVHRFLQNNFLPNSLKSCFQAVAFSIVGLILSFLPYSLVQAQTPQGITILESSPLRLVIEYTPEVLGFDTLKVQGRVTLQPRIKGAIATGKQAGSPVWLQVQMPVAVPSPDGFRIAEQSVQGVKSYSEPMTPRRILLRSFAKPDASPYVIDETMYSAASTQAIMPAWTQLDYGGIGRDKYIATLTLCAARYNAERGAIEIPQRIRVSIDFDAASNSAQAASKLDIINSGKGFSQTINDGASQSWGVAQANAQATSPKLPAFPSINTPPATNPAPSPKSQGAQTLAVEGRWLRIGVEREGIYRVTAQQLREAGMTITPQEVASIRLYGNGGEELSERPSDAEKNIVNEQPIFAETDASGALTAIVFYGAAPNGFIFKNGIIQHFVNTFSKRNFYVLNVGASGQGRRATFAESPASPAFTPTYYTARVFRDDDKFNPFDATGDGSGRRWFGDRLSSGTPTRYETPMPNLVTNADPILYRLSTAWNSQRPTGAGGEIFVKEAGTNLFPSPIRFAGALYEYDVGEVKTISVTAPAASIRNNRSTLEFLYVSGSANGDNAGAVDWYEIHYPRSFVAVDNQIDFFAEPFNTRFGVAEYNVNGFTSGEQVYIVDATNRAQPQFVRNLNTNRSVSAAVNVTFRASITTDSVPRRFYLSSQTLAAASLEATSLGDLRGTAANAELIVITDKDLKASADAYRTYRQSTGMATTVVTTEQVYNEFNGGTPDPTALRDYISFAYRNWAQKPRYVLLWGDGHFDYRGLDPTNKPKNFVPTYQFYDADGDMNSVNTNYMTEDYFVQVLGDDQIVDLALGRLCVRSNDEGNVMLSKIRQYETTSSSDNWRSQITLIADDGPTTSIVSSDRSLHSSQSETLANTLIPQDIRARKIYMADYPTENVPGGRRRPSVTQEMVAAVNEGTVILNWIGHGNPRLWAHENIFVKDINIPQFTNLDRLFFLVAATCDFARFDNLREQSGAEDMISSPRGGAIGTFAAARTVYALDNAAISQALYEQLFRNTSGLPAPRIGDAFFRVKQLFYSGSFQNDLKFCLLGDPTVRLSLPEQRIVLENFNGMPAQEMTQVKALSTVSLSGFVSAPGSTNQADTSFTGSLIGNLYDTDIQKAAVDVDVDRTIHRFTTLGGLLNIGSAAVKNGRFSMSFTVPKDISFSNKNGRMFLYAVNSENRKYGRGMTTNFTLGDVNENAVNDQRGPDIRLFMDTRTFRAGDIVDSTPRLIADLYDSTGINATGSGIGHDIQCWIDDNQIPINLTSSFRISLADPRRGEVNRVLAKLAPGEHRIRVRAWDVFNNFSEAETYFRVGASGGGTILTDVLNFPNPFTVSTTIRFRHNQLTAQPYTIVIANITGAEVKRFTGMTNARTMDIPWDGRNESGTNVANGAYIYRVDLTGANGEMKSASGLMLLAR